MVPVKSAPSSTGGRNNRFFNENIIFTGEHKVAYNLKNISVPFQQRVLTIGERDSAAVENQTTVPVMDIETLQK